MVSSTDTIRCTRPHYVKNRAFLPQTFAPAVANVCEGGCKRLRGGLQTFASKQAFFCSGRLFLTAIPCIRDGFAEIGDRTAAHPGIRTGKQNGDELMRLDSVDGQARYLLHHPHHCPPPPRPLTGRTATGRHSDGVSPHYIYIGSREDSSGIGTVRASPCSGEL